ncbi:MAG: tetratricopeptide repeat protein, partial [Candidatus Omnitrophota bacterium]|nr:tetratricopeptide repeat protein [Candidatus Omnitrophota bacterium]
MENRKWKMEKAFKGGMTPRCLFVFPLSILYLPFSILLFVSVPVAAQDVDLMLDDPAANQEILEEDLADEFITTEIGLDQIIVKKDMLLKPDTGYEAPAGGRADGEGWGLGELNEHQVIKLNRTLRKMIEENEKLSRENKNLDGEARRLRGQERIDRNRLTSASNEIEDLKRQLQTMMQGNLSTEQEVADLRKKLEEAEKLAAQQPKMLEAPDVLQDETSAAMEEPLFDPWQADTVVGDKAKSADVLAMIEKYNKQRDAVRANEAKVHYNMGNMYVKQRNYRRAIGEYRRAVRLWPDDSAAHFNLAFVSGEYLNDYRTALDHFKKYLDLSPQAADSALVMEKIVEAELHLKAMIDSSLESEVNK